MMNSSRTAPGGLAAAGRRRRSPSGSSTSCTQRGTSTGATRAGGAGGGCLSGCASSGPGSPTPSSGFAASVLRVPRHAPTIASRHHRNPLHRRRRRAGRAPGRCASCCPGLREELAPDFVVVNGENAAGGLGITPKEADEFLGAGRRRDHARQPHLPPPRGLAVPGGGAADRAPVQLPARRSRAAGRRSSSRTACRSAIVNLSGIVHLQAGSPPLVAVDAALREVVRRRPRARRHARRGDEREGRAGLVPGRQGDRGGRHPHARPDRRRARAAGRHGLHHRRRHDRRPRRRDRDEEGAVDRGHAHAHADALRALRGGPVDQRGADPRRRAPRAGRRRSRAYAYSEMLHDHRRRCRAAPTARARSSPARCRPTAASAWESLACSEPCEPPPMWCAPPQSRNS